MQPKRLKSLKVIFTCVLRAPYSLIMCSSNQSAFLTNLSPFCALYPCLYDEISWTLHTNMPTVKGSTRPVRCRLPCSPAPAWGSGPLRQPLLRCQHGVWLRPPRHSETVDRTISLRLPTEKLLLFSQHFAQITSDFFRCFIIWRFLNMPSVWDRSRYQRSDISSVLYVECVLLIFLSVFLYPTKKIKEKDYNAKSPWYKSNAWKTKIITLEVFYNYFF